MRNKQVTAILLSAVMAISICAPMNSMTSFAAENVAEESTESEAKAEVPIEAESADELEDQENAAEESTESEAEAEVPIETESTDELEVQEESESVGEALTVEESSDLTDEVEMVEVEERESGAGDVSRDDSEADSEEDVAEEPSTEETTDQTIEDAAETDEIIVENTEQVDNNISTLAGDVIDSGKCGDNVTYTLTGTDSDMTLTISGNGDMDAFYLSSTRLWDPYFEKISNVIVEDGVTSIGQGAFSDLNLSIITLPNSVTSIGVGAFACCSRLTSITIPDSVTSIGDSAFERCSSLTSITIPNSVIEIGECAFEDCTSLTNITIPNSVTSIGSYAFEDCTSLTNITIPNSVTSIGTGAFWGCSSLTSITIPNSVTSIEYLAFSGCSSLTSITIPDGVMSIEGELFSGCTSLSSIMIPDSVTSIESHAFAVCSSLTSITIPESVTSIGEEAFYSCSSLTSITIPESVTFIGDYTFEGCEKLSDLYYAGTKKEWDAIEGSSFVYDMNCILHTTDGVYGNAKAQKIALNKSSATIVKGKTLQLKATVTPADATDGKVTWKSSNTKVATVTSTGSIKAVSAGSTTITAVTEGGLKATCTIKVVNPYTIKFDKNVDKKVAAKVTLTTKPKKVNPGDTLSTLPTPGYSGYYFLGWYTARSGGTKVTPSTKPTKNMTLYAHWVKVQSLAKATVTVASCTYNTKAQKPKVTVKLGSKTLKEGTDYTLTYANNKIASKKAVVTVKGKNAYKASVKKTFTINQKDISKNPVSIKLKKTKFGYTGKAIKPGYTAAITVDGKAVNLVNGTDFKVAYKNNVRIGTASIVFTGKGNYKGTKTLKFYILKKATVTLDLNKGTGSRVTPVLPKGSQNTVEILAGEKIGKIPTPTRKGYTFVGWYTTPKATGGNLIVSGRTRFAASETKNQKIYARWKRNTYKITFKYDKNGLGLTCPFTLPKEMTYNVEKAVTLPVLTSEYAKFNGWKNVPTAVTTDKLIKKIGEKPTSGDLVLYLDYTNYEYSIEFSGGDGGSVSNGVKHCFTWFSKDTLPLVSCTPPAGKKFDKWYCTENGQYYQDGAEFSRLTTENGKVFHFVALWRDPIWRERMEQFITLDAYKDGARWGTENAPLISNYGCSQCRGYAADFVAYVYGGRNKKSDPITTPYDSYVDANGGEKTDITEIRAGDIVCDNARKHVFVVLDINWDTGEMLTAEGNNGDSPDATVRIGNYYRVVKNSDGKYHLEELFSNGWAEQEFNFTRHYGNVD